MMRDQIGYDNTLMMDANQIWDVPQVSVIFIMVSSQIRLFIMGSRNVGK